MFGHQDDQSASEANNSIASEPAGDTNNSTDAEDQPSGQPPQSAPAEPASPHTDPVAAPPTTGNDSWQHPGTPLTDNNDAISPAGGYPMRPTYQYSAGASPTDAPTTGTDDSANRELIDIKEHALDELSPLIDKLDLQPEEKFRTLMMMIQASDNQGLVKAAYAAAHSIEDEKVRAQALLDIINEVNYFTHQPEA